MLQNVVFCVKSKAIEIKQRKQYDLHTMEITGAMEDNDDDLKCSG